MQSGEYGPHNSNGAYGLIGRVIGGYTLERELGSGATGIVFLGRRVENSTDMAAIKVLMLPPQLPEEERAEFRERFMREAQLLFQLRHAHILPIYAFGEDQATGYAYMVLPYLEGGPFTNRLKQGPLPLDIAAQYIAQAAEALDFAHTRSIVHRDVKPANLLLDSHDQLFLADFGIARLFDTVGGGMTTTGRILGTAAYMSPEQALGQHAGPAADIYSLGVLLYQLVAGHLPFDAPTQSAVMLQHIQQTPPSPRRLRPDLPQAAEEAILRALAKRPEERFPSAGALAYAFAEGLQGRRTQAPYASVPSMGSTVQAYQVSPTQVAPTPSMLPTIPAYTPTYAPGYIKQRSHSYLPMGLAALAVIVVVVLLFANASSIGAAVFGNRGSNSTAATSTATRTTDHSSDTTNTTNNDTLVPSGNPLYKTSAPGICDSNSGNWGQNPSAVQSCGQGGLILAGPNCPCPLGVVTLASIAGQAYPQDFVLEVSAQSLGSDSTAYFGFKFRQQSLQDTGQGRGGYAFLIAQNGRWEYNRYSSSGTRNIIAAGRLPVAVNTSNTLDLVVNGAGFSFFVNGHQVSQEADSTYSQGYLCLVAEPGARVLFSDFALYALP